MKKGKVFKKSQVALAVMVVALAAAVWLNMKYSGVIENTDTNSSSKYLGQAEYVNAEVSEEKKTEDDYFKNVKKSRETARKEALDILDETLDREDLSEEDKAAALAKSNALAAAAVNESGIETVLKAKGFSDAVVVIGESEVNVVVRAESLDTAQTAQIQDAVTAQTGFSATNIKIITVK